MTFKTYCVNSTNFNNYRLPCVKLSTATKNVYHVDNLFKEVQTQDFAMILRVNLDLDTYIDGDVEIDLISKADINLALTNDKYQLTFPNVKMVSV